MRLKQSGKLAAKQTMRNILGIRIVTKLPAKLYTRVAVLQSMLKTRRVHFRLHLSAIYPMNNPVMADTTVKVIPPRIAYSFSLSPRSMDMLVYATSPELEYTVR